MKIFQFSRSNIPGIGIMSGAQEFVDLHRAAPDLPRDILELMNLPDGLVRAHKAAQQATPEPLLGITFLPPISRPNAIWALALNFKTHIEETGLQTSPHFPHVFMRHAASLVGHEQNIIAPPESVGRAFDYEGELAVIIGKPGRHIPVEKAMTHVAGFTCCNEGSVREFQSHNRQFGLGKNFGHSGSIGPWITTTDEIPDYNRCEIRTKLNGIIRQRSSLSDMLFSVEKVINYLSKGYYLQTGDIIMMGTPGALQPLSKDDPGADMSLQYGRFKVPGLVHMRPGDVCEVEIDGIGVLRNNIAADLPEEYRVS